MSVPSPAFRFGQYRLDIAARELHCRGKLAGLSPKVFDCLAWLFEHRDRAVGRDELSAAVWGRADITDAQIDQLIRKVRRVLGDSGSDQEVIRTVPRFGYRWVAEVQIDDEPVTNNPTAAEAAPGPGAATPDPAVPPAMSEPDRATDFPGNESGAPAPVAVRRPARRRALVAAAGATLAVLLAAAFLMQPDGLSRMPLGATQRSESEAESSGAAHAQVDAARYAVLPVALDGEDDGEWAWLRLGMMDLIAARLREGGVTVVPASNVVALIGKDSVEPLDPVAVRNATGAGVLVQPSVRRTDGGWRVRIEIDGAEGAAREMEVHAGDAIDGARAAADRLLVLLGRAPLPTERSSDDSATDLLARRIDAAISGSDYELARQLLETVAPPRRDEAEFRMRRAYVQRALGHAAEARDLFQAVLDSDAERALGAPIRAGALIGLGVMHLQEGDTDDARQRLDQAVTLTQRERLPLAYADAMASRATLNAAQGRESEADSDFAQARIALEMSADTLGMAELDANQAATLLSRHRYAEARPLLERSIERMQRFPPGETLISALGNRIFMHLAFLEPREALSVAEDARDSVARVGLIGKRQAFAMHEARALLANGHLERAREVIDAVAADVDAAQTPSLHASVLGNQAHLNFEARRWEVAAEFAARHLDVLAVPALATPVYARTRASSARLRIRALLNAGKARAAEEAFVAFTAWAGTESDPSVTTLLHLARAELAADAHRDEVAAEAYESALAAARRGAAPADVARVAVSWAGHLIGSARLDEATRIAGQVSRWAGQCFECAATQARLYRVLGQDRLAREALATATSLAGERELPDEVAASSAPAAFSVGRERLSPSAAAAGGRRN